MKIVSFFVCAFALAAQLPAVTLYPGVTGKPLLDSLTAHYKTSTTLGYDGARAKMYGEIDCLGGTLTCVYGGFALTGGPTSDPMGWAAAGAINCEHSWPQSQLSGIAVSDMHHLYPTWDYVNNARGNLPFGDVIDAETNKWFIDKTTLTSIPTSNIDGYSELKTNSKFEPREVQKGNTARSMFYMLTMYKQADTTADWWTGQKDDLRQWHLNDPVDAAESTRTWKIAAYQQNKPNPFVLDPTLVDRSFFPQYATNTTVRFAAASATRNESDGSTSLTVSITNPSGSAATAVDVVLDNGSPADIGGFTQQTLTFPSGSSANQSATITITDDALIEGNESLTFKLRNVSGGTSAAIGSDSVFTLVIVDNDAITVQFSPTSDVKLENEFSTELTLSIANPSPTTATTVDVVLAGGTGTAADIGDYTTQTVTFPANSSASRSITVNITDDLTVEANETFVFKLRNAGGPANAVIGADSAFTLTVIDNDGSTTSDTIAFQGFEFAKAVYDWPIVAGDSYASTETGTLDTPVNQRIRTGVKSWQDYNNQRIELELAPVSLVGRTNVSLAAHVTGVSTNTATNGLDAGDSISFFVALNGAAFGATPDLILRGAAPNNARWGYNATLTAITTAGTPASFQAPQGGDNTNNYSTIQINIPDGNSSVAFKIFAENSAGNPNEVWNVDDITLTGTITGVAGRPVVSLPATDLVQNAPNPFSYSTIIRYSLTKQSVVRLSVYNVMGQTVYATQPRSESGGDHNIAWSGGGLPQGVYFYQLVVDDKIVATRRMTLIK